jgi:hypothetical protein
VRADEVIEWRAQTLVIAIPPTLFALADAMIE